ncbi:MAG: ABC transporter permease [Gemmatimonadales bacterium]
MPLFSMTDVRDAARGLLRAPTISISAVLCLGLGLGSTAAISSAIDRALLQAPPFGDPGGLVTVYRTAPQANTWPFSAPNYLDLARATKKLSSLSVIAYNTNLLTLPGEAIQVNSLAVTGNLFPSLRVRPQYGRLLTPADDANDQNLVAVMSDELWREHFAADPRVVGKTISLDGKQVTVVGIAPRQFRIPRGGQVLQAQLWTPMRFTQSQRSQRRSNYLMAMGRLAPGANVAEAQAELSRLFDEIVAIHPDLRGEGVRVVPLQSESVAAVRTPLLLVFGAVAMVLLIAATDVASLLLARGVHRRRETAIRSALGGGRWAVMRPVFLESVLLALVGVVLGLGLAWIGVRTIGTLASQRLPQLAGLQVDLRVVGFALILALVVALGCGVIPAWRTATVDPQDALRDGRGGGMGRGGQRALGALVVIEVALSLVLLVGAGLVLKGFSRLVGNAPGFDPAPILTLQATISPQAYPDTNGGVRRFAQFLEPALAAIRQVPGVAAAGSIQLIPYDNWGWNFNVRYEGQPGDNPSQLPLVENRIISPDFFGVTRQRLISGRLLRESDDERTGSPYVVVVNQALVKRDFAGRDPIGKRFYTGDTTFGTIVGVVSDIKNVGPVAPPSPEMYATFRQSGNGFSAFPIMIRVARGDPMAVLPAVRAAIRGIDRGAAITQVRTMTDVMATSVGRPRFYLTLLGTFALVAMVLAVAGLYGVLSYAVAQRTRELGIRNALGSSSSRLVGLVAGQGLRLVALGVVFGLIGAAAATRLLSGLLYGVSPLDTTTWIVAAALLVLAGMIAAAVPSWRAIRIDPLEAMRTE